MVRTALAQYIHGSGSGLALEFWVERQGRAQKMTGIVMDGSFWHSLPCAQEGHRWLCNTLLSENMAATLRT